MKKLLFAVSALAALSLLAPSSGLAQIWYNHVGIYADAEGTTATVTADLYSTVTAYVVVTNPYNFAEGRDIATISGIEFGLVKVGNTITSSIAFPCPSVNIGLGDEVICGFASPFSPVTAGGSCVVATYAFIPLAATAFFLAPTTPASVPNLLACLDQETEGVIGLYPSSGAFDAQVFDINLGTTVATEESTLGSIKALYR